MKYDIKHIAKDMQLEMCQLDKQNQTLIADSNNLIQIIQDLKLKYKFEQLLDIVAVDYLHYELSERKISEAIYPNASTSIPNQSKENRYGLIYNLLSITNKNRIKVKTYLKKTSQTHSITKIFEIANWYEREAYDLFGINFTKHPNLTRILTDDNFKDHPMRKDFPVTGLYEIQYDNEKRKIVKKKTKIKYLNDTPKVIKG